MGVFILVIGLNLRLRSFSKCAPIRISSVYVWWLVYGVKCWGPCLGHVLKSMHDTFSTNYYSLYATSVVGIWILRFANTFLKEVEFDPTMSTFHTKGPQNSKVCHL